MTDLTLGTDERGIWLRDDAAQGLKQIGFISWEDVTRNVQACLLQEKILTALDKMDSADTIDEYGYYGDSIGPLHPSMTGGSE